MSDKRYSFEDYPEHKEYLQVYADKWVKNALNTEPLTDEEKEGSRRAVANLYKQAGYRAPNSDKVVFVESPFIGHFTAGFATAIHHLLQTRGYKKMGQKAKEALEKPSQSGPMAEAVRQATRLAVVDKNEPGSVGGLSLSDKDTSEFSDRWYKFPLREMAGLDKELGLEKFGLVCSEQAFRLWQGSSFWSSICAYLNFFEEVAKLDIDWSKFQDWKYLAQHGGSVRYLHENFTVLVDRPQQIHIDDEGQPHNESGPFCLWRDGSAMYSVHGVRVPEWVVMKESDQVTGEDISSLDNAEVRRVLINRIGVNRAYELLGGEVLDKKDYSGREYFKTHQGRDYELIECDFGTGGKRRALKMNNATIDHVHIEFVHPECETVDQALGFRERGLIGDAWRDRNYVYQPPEILT